MSRTMAVVWVLAGILVALPLSYERLAMIFGPIIVKIAIGVVGEILYMQVVFIVGGTVVMGLVAAGVWLCEHHPTLAVVALVVLVIASAMFRT